MNCIQVAMQNHTTETKTLDLRDADPTFLYLRIQRTLALHRSLAPETVLRVLVTCAQTAQEIASYAQRLDHVSTLIRNEDGVHQVWFIPNGNHAP